MKQEITPQESNREEAYKAYNNLSLPLTEQLAAEVVSLPIAPYLTDEDVAYIAQVINRYEIE